MRAWQNKKVLVPAIAAALLAIVAVCIMAGFFFGSQGTEAARSEESLAEFEAENSHTAGLNEAILLDSHEDSLGADVGYFVAFGWNGSMKVTLTGVSVYDSMDDAGIAKDNPFYVDPNELGLGAGEWKFMVCNVALENIDADPDPSFDDEYFSVSPFRLVIEGNSTSFFPPDAARLPDFFDGTIPNATPKQLYLFSLTKGATGQYRLGYCVQEEDVYKPCALRIGIREEYPKYQIMFTITPDMVVGSMDG